MGWFSDFTDDVLGIDSNKGTFLGVGGKVGEVALDAVDWVSDTVEDSFDYVKEQVDDAIDYVEDDLGISLEAVAAIGLAFVPGMQGVAASMLSAIPGVSAGLGTAVASGIATGAKIGLTTGTVGQTVNYIQTGEFDFEEIGQQGLRGAAGGAIMGGAQYGLERGITYLAGETSDALRSMGFEGAADAVAPADLAFGPTQPTYLDTAFGYLDRAVYGMTGEVAMGQDPSLVGALGGVLSPASSAAFVGLSGGMAGAATGGSDTGTTPMMQGLTTGTQATGTGAGGGQSIGTGSNQGSTQPMAQFIETGGGQFGSPGAGGVFGGFDTLDSQDTFVDVGATSDLYAQREVGAMVTARS